MADVNYENIPSIIGIYEGTVASFEGIMNGTDTAKKQTFYGRLILITGDQTATDENAADRKQALWTSEDDGSNAHYLNMSDVATLKAQLAHIDGIAFPKNDGTAGYDKYDLTGGKGFIFKGSNGITVKINPATSTPIDGKPYWTIEVNGQTLKADLIGNTDNGSNTATHPDTIRGAKAYADSLYVELKGTKDAGDTTAQTIEGAKDYADKVKADLEGTKAEGDTTAQTIEGAKKYADGKAAAAKNEAIASSEAYANTMKAQAISSSVVSVDTTTTTEGASKSYTFKQGGVTIATIDIPKDMVVSKGSVVKGTWNGDTFTESTSGTGTAIKLEIANGDTLYINAATLVNVYTAQQNATEIQLEVSAPNVISATIVNGAVSEAKIAANAVTTAKIKDGNVTKAKLETTVQASLDKADSAIVALGGDDYIEVKNVGATTTDKKITAKTAEITSETATTDGLATVADIRAYLAARFSVKVVS